MPVIEGFAERSAGGAGGAIEGFQPRIISDRQRPTGSPSVLGFANDTIVTGVNSALGIGKAVSDFVSVDNPVSRGIQWLIDEGEETYTPQTRQAREDLFRAIDAGGTDAARGVGEFLLTSPVQAAAMAAGNFGPFGAFIKGARGIAALRGASAAGQRRAGIAAASGMGGAAAGGDAAGDAYEQVMRSPNVDPAVKEQLARQAAREASVVPAIIGAATPFLPGSAESQLARGLGLTRASIPRAAASEFGQEFIEEGATKLSANLAARQYDETIDPSRGVFGSALLGGALGAGTGAGVTFLNNRAVEADLLRRDEALQAAERARQAAERAPYSELPANFFDRIDTDNEVGLGIVRPINPYDAAGYVSAFQEGQDTELGSPQAGLFGNAGGLEQEVEVLAPPAPPAPAAPASKVFSADETELIEMRVNPTPAVRTLWAEAKAAGLSPNELDTIGSELAKSYGQGRKAYKAILLARNAPAASAAPAAPSLVPPNLSLPTAEQIAADQKANPQDWGPSLNVKAPASVAQAPGVTSLPVEPATAPATVARPGTYAVSDAISADGPVEETIRLIVRPDGTSAILRNDGSLIDVTNMVRAGFTAEQAIAQSLGDDTSGANVKSVQAEAPAEAAVPAAPTQGTTDPAASEPVVQRKRRVVNPAALAQSQAFVAPEPIAEEGPTTDPDDDSLEIARLTGQGDLAGALASEMEGTRADKDEISDDAFDSILAERFKDSKDPKRDRAIFNAYLTQMRVAPQGSKALVAESIAQQFGIKPVAVRKVGNPQEVARVAESMGFSAEDVLSRMGVTSRPPSKDAKSQETDSERAALKAALEAAQKRAEAAKADPARKQLRDAMAAIDAGIESAPAAQQATLRAQRSELQRQLQALADEQFKAEDEVASIKQSIDDIEQSRSAAADTALTQGMRDVGVETVEGDTLGYGFDDSREWQKSSSSGNREADVLLRVQQRIEGLRRTIAQLEEQGQTEAVEELRARLDEETQKLDKQLAKHAKPAAPTRALSDELKAAKEKFKAAKFDVAKMEPEELQLLRGEAERFKNKALIDKIDARLREVGAEATAPVSEVSRPPNYAEYSQEELQKLLEDAPQINLNLDVQAIKKYLGEEAAAAYAGMSPRMRDKWWGENATEEMDRESSSSNGIDEETVTEFLKSHSNFSTESARELGRSVGVIARKADDPGFNSSPEFVTLKNAFAYAARMGWSPEEVLAGMRERANEWAKDDAAALFKRLFKPTADKSSTPAALAPAQEPKVRVVKKAQAATPKTEAAAPAPAAPAEVLTTTEQAAKAWDQAANTIPGAPKWAELPAATQNEFKGYGENNWTRQDVVALMQRADFRGSNDATSQRERDLRAKSRDKEQPGDVMLATTGKFVSMEDALEAARAAVESGALRPDAPFQYNAVLDIAPRDWNRMVQAMKGGGPKFSKAAGAGGTVDGVYAALAKFFYRSPESFTSVFGRHVRVHQTEAQAVAAVKGAISAQEMERAQGFVDPRDDRVVHLIADNIRPGTELAVLLHEVGVHVGLLRQLGANFELLAQQVRSWGALPERTLERRVHDAAMARVVLGRLDGSISEDVASEELVAYAAEEAVLAGVQPSPEASNRLSEWLHRLQKLVESAFKSLFGRKVAMKALTAQNLVDFAKGAAEQHLEMTLFEQGALPSAKPTDVLRYYAKSEPDQEVNDDAKVEDFDTDKPGEEGIYWGADSRFGPHTSISTFAETFVDPGEQPHEKGFNEISVYLLSGESRGLYASTGNLDDAILQTVSLRYDAGSDLWSLAVFGPEFDSDLFDKLEVLGQATKLHQDQQFVWTRLEGVPLSDTLEMLAEARRRLTRALGGEVPAIYWNRATGAKPGKTGVYLPEDVVRRFSTRPAERTGFGSEEQENPDVNSRGRKIHHTAEGIRNFWRWFAGSKVVDKDGKPMVMYHGTGESFEEFRQDAPAAHLKLPGLFFTQDPATAEIYTQNVDRQFKGRNIIPVYLRMTNPKKINARDFTGKQAREALLRAREEGHDGAILYGIGVTRFPEYVVFDSTQVKSAIGNTGAFSSSDPRMRFSKRSTQRLPAELQKPVGVITNTLRDVGNAALNTLTFTEDVINRAVDLGIKGAGRLRSIYQERAALTGKLEREVERVADLYNRVPESERGTGPRSVNQFLYDATREGKWGFKPDWRKGPSAAVTLDPEMLRRYGALSKESKELVRSIFRHGDEVLSLKKQTVIDSTNSEYDALIAAASKAGDKNKVARLTADKAEQLKRFSSLFELQEFRPYAPLRRFGNYVVIARSQKYLDADEKQKRQLEKSEDHYHVSFAESAAAARELVEQLQKQGAFAEVVFRQKEAVQQTMFGGTLSAFNKLRSELDSELADAAPGEKAALRAARKVVGELYLSTLAENSARKSEMRRRGVAGEIDVLRSFTTQGRADAQFIAGAKYNGQTLDVFNAMRREVKSGDAEAQNTKSGVFNELMKRHTQSMDYDPTPIASKLARLTSIWFLATSPAYYLQNLTQPFMLSLPFMAGRHNYLKATNALLKAYTDLAPMFRTAKLGEQFNFDAAPQDVRAAISTLVDRGRIDIGMDTDLGRFQIEGQGQFKDRWNKIDRGIYRAAQKLEAVNRLSTAIAAYRMELAKGGDPAKALEYADNVISQTHGDYTANNAPRAFNTPTGKVALQFRKFQLIQLTLLAKLVSNSFPGKKDAAVARQTLAFTLGHTAVMAGAIGLPGFAAISWLLGALGFGDDEEPFNAEKELREFIGNDQLATLITRGVPAALGVDLSNKLGMGNVLSILPFNELDLSSRSGLESAAFSAFGGPAGALTLRAADGINLIRDGQYYKGLEQLMPTGVTNAMRAYRTGKEGVTRRNGDVLISPEEISGMDSFWQYIGFQPTKLAERQFFDRVVRDTDRAFQSRADKIRSAYLRAGDDYEAKAEARDRWAELQDAREAAGYRRQPLSALLRAEQSQDERERNTLGGVQFNRNNRSFVQELIEAEE